MNFIKQIIWQGDLNDDCLSNWNGLLLRAECMADNDWWWCVYDMDNDEIQIDSSNNHSMNIIDGALARKLAEDCARNYRNDRKR